MAEVLTEGQHMGETPLDPESAKVIEWRRVWLRHAGYSKRNVELLATSRVDLHLACDALKHAKERKLPDAEAYVMGLFF